MPLCGMTAPHFTTIAHFVSTLLDDIAQLLAAVLTVCDGQGLIGREMFAIDGVKLPSNASTHRSGTRVEFTPRAEKLETAARIARLTKDARPLREWLATHPADHHGPTGGLRKSNRTDNESAKMATDKGVVQGYTGVAAVDAKHQIIVEAQAHGTGSERELLQPAVPRKDVRQRGTAMRRTASYLNSALKIRRVRFVDCAAFAIVTPPLRQSLAE